MVLLASELVGPYIDRIATFLGYPPGLVQVMAARLQEAKVWESDEVRCESWFDPKKGGHGFHAGSHGRRRYDYSHVVGRKEAILILLARIQGSITVCSLIDGDSTTFCWPVCTGQKKRPCPRRLSWRKDTGSWLSPSAGCFHFRDSHNPQDARLSMPLSEMDFCFSYRSRSGMASTTRPFLPAPFETSSTITGV
jgi:hypothetical protein